MFSYISHGRRKISRGARVIRAYVQEQAEIAASRAPTGVHPAQPGAGSAEGMLWPTLNFMLGAAVVIVLWLGGRQVLTGKMNVGDFVAFNTYMMQLTWPVIALGGSSTSSNAEPRRW